MSHKQAKKLRRPIVALQNVNRKLCASAMDILRENGTELPWRERLKIGWKILWRAF